MKLKLSTDYVIRIVLYLSMKKQSVSLKELSENLSIDEYYILKFSKKLYDTGIVKRDDNMKDRFYLTKEPSQIKMFDIINVMENTIKINLCLEEDEYCSRLATETCPVRKFYCELQNNIESYLKSKTIQDLINI
ncbi:Rrf2 family transcriptional regulator [Clostridium perfringens]|uniref:RrF2 family transcriptional regulator n=1 Tax=Clostridium perfringens TaxID=1502 RepID=UPI001CCF0CCD|nr:Rrf2 family transcriptional regulator [Clostridium perfringens]UBK98051.1 Rrf2 family transcriptional regulator [Clostridium perfringens]